MNKFLLYGAGGVLILGLGICYLGSGDSSVENAVGSEVVSEYGSEGNSENGVDPNFGKNGEMMAYCIFKVESKFVKTEYEGPFHESAKTITEEWTMRKFLGTGKGAKEVGYIYKDSGSNADSEGSFLISGDCFSYDSCVVDKKLPNDDRDYYSYQSLKHASEIYKGMFGKIYLSDGGGALEAGEFDILEVICK